MYFVTHCQYEFPDEDSVVHTLKQSQDHKMSILLLTHLAHYTLQGLGDNLTVLEGTGMIFSLKCVVRGLSRQREDTTGNTDDEMLGSAVPFWNHPTMAVQSHSGTTLLQLTLAVLCQMHCSPTLEPLLVCRI